PSFESRESRKTLLPGKGPYDTPWGGQVFCARPFPAEDLTTPADVGDENGGGLLALEADHQMIFAVSPHDGIGTLVIRSDLPSQVRERPSYILPALSRTRHTFLPYSPPIGLARSSPTAPSGPAPLAR